MDLAGRPTACTFSLTMKTFSDPTRHTKAQFIRFEKAVMLDWF
jgi:hypothetical protein